ncbi:RAB6-interacting golgin isoform X2 [Pristis pectinata]|uniref:RAB6-interacting golgin isoform X2 n=1 Tax=Pristis pectinata TaxID=685728 RepID=UPI00223D228E|nr:RAB6-interacting golgin isoform X2 [Pristis pectinata]
MYVRQLMYIRDPLILEKPEKFGRAPSTNKSRQQLQRERALNQHCRKTNGHNEVPFILPEQQLAKPKMNPPQAAEPPAPELGPKPIAQEANKQLTATEESCQKEMDKPGAKASCTFQDSSVKELSTEQVKGVELRERSRLEQLQLEQRLMEEKNKRKKALLSKAIAERSKRTMAETVKLKHIQKELQNLDDLLSNGVNVLRNRIEQSSWEYYQAKKRYDKAEVEYVAAKLDLHKKIELKEQLTEHLCAIIQQNELRKAKKLEELMQQLEMEADEEQLELEIEVENMLQRQELAKASDQTNAGSEESSKQTIQEGGSQSHTLKQTEKEAEGTATCDTGRKNSKDSFKIQEAEN